MGKYAEQIYRSTLKLMAQTSLEKVCKVSVQEAGRLLGTKYGSVFWWSDDRLVRIYSNIPKQEQIEPRPNGNVIQVFQNRRPRFVSSTIMQRVHPEKNGQVSSLTLIPLSYAKKPLGVMSLHTDDNANVLADKENTVKLFGSLVTLAIRNIQLHQQREEAINQQELFMSLASHELKTPLTIISTAVQLIERKSNNVEMGEFIARIKTSTQKLRMIVEEFFSVSEVSAGKLKLQLEKTALTKFVKKTVQDLRIIHPQKISFSSKLAASKDAFLIDAQKISLVLTNLVNNAAKYSAKESVISVAIQPKWNGAQISITDKGQGIDKDDVQHIFNKFFQGKNKQSGLGLGLFLAKEIVEAHQGVITLTSQKGRGTKVTLWLPTSHE